MTYTPPKVPSPPAGMGPWMRSVEQWIQASERITPASKGITSSDIVPGAVTYVTVAQGATSTGPPGTWPRADFEKFSQSNAVTIVGNAFTHQETIDGIIYWDLTTSNDSTMQPGFMGLLDITTIDAAGGAFPDFPKLTIRSPTSPANGTPRAEISLGQLTGQYGSDNPPSHDVRLYVERDYLGREPDPGGTVGQNSWTLSSGNGLSGSSGGTIQGIAGYSYSDLGTCVFTMNSGDYLANSATMSHYDNATQQRASMRLGENDGGIEIAGLAGLFSRDYYSGIMNSITVDGTGIRLDTATYCYSTLRVNGTTTLVGDVTINGNLTVGGTYPSGGGASAPTGAIMIWPTATAPSTWVLCQGQAVSRTGTYAALFAVIGTLYGVGDGSTTFNLPDLTGRVAAGFKSADPDFGTLAAAVGASTVAGAAHTHTSAAHTHTSAAHTHTLSAAGQASIQFAGAGKISMIRQADTFTSNYDSTSATAVPGGAASTAATVGVALAGATDSTTPGVTGSTTPGVTGSTSPTATSVIQPSLTLNYIIKL